MAHLGLRIVDWFRDLSAFAPVFQTTIEQLDSEIFDVVYHMQQQRSEVLSWTTRDRRDTLRRLIKQRELEKEALTRH